MQRRQAAACVGSYAATATHQMNSFPVGTSLQSYKMYAHPSHPDTAASRDCISLRWTQVQCCVGHAPSTFESEGIRGQNSEIFDPQIAL